MPRRFSTRKPRPTNTTRVWSRGQASTPCSFGPRLCLARGRSSTACTSAAAAGKACSCQPPSATSRPSSATLIAQSLVRHPFLPWGFGYHIRLFLSVHDLLLTLSFTFMHMCMITLSANIFLNKRQKFLHFFYK